MEGVEVSACQFVLSIVLVSVYHVGPSAWIWTRAWRRPEQA